MDPVAPQPPVSVEDAVAALGLIDDVVDWVAPDRGTLWVALTPDLVVHVAHDEATRARVAVEDRRLRWAAGHGIPVPPVEGLHPQGLVTRRVREDGLVGAAAGCRAVEVARMVAAAPPPPPDVRAGGGPRQRGGGRSLHHAVRLLGGHVRPAEFLGLRRAVAALPVDTTVHGDYQPRNLLWDRPAGVLHVIDWEMLGRGQAGADLFTLWPQVEDAAAREVVLDGALQAAGGGARAAVLHRWLAVRYLADIVVVPAAERDHRRARLARQMVAEARANARRWRDQVS